MPRDHEVQTLLRELVRLRERYYDLSPEFGDIFQTIDQMNQPAEPEEMPDAP